MAALGDVEPGQQLVGAFHVEIRMHPGDVVCEVAQALVPPEGPVFRGQVNRPGCSIGELPAEDLCLTGVPGLAAGEQPQQRGLARPVPPDQARHRTEGRRQVHLLQHRPRPQPNLHILQPEGCFTFHVVPLSSVPGAVRPTSRELLRIFAFCATVFRIARARDSHRGKPASWW